MLCLLGSDKPVIESLQPNPVDQTEALENQFAGMSDIPFSYQDYEETRRNLIQQVNENLTEIDRDFLLSFENGDPDWKNCCAGDLSSYPEMDACEVRPFACVSFTRKSFVYFPDVKMYQEVFLESYIRLVRLSELHLL